MENKLFDINGFNIIQDDENYYFFRALNMADMNDIEQNITTENEASVRVRTDRERSVKEEKYHFDSELTLEQVYDHIKMYHRKDTNCISLSSNAGVSVTYGRGNYKDRYILVKVPKEKMGEKVICAGEYMLKEIEREINKYIATLKDENVLQSLRKIDQSTTTEELREIIKVIYTSKEKLSQKKPNRKKGITYRPPVIRMSSYQVLNEEQIFEKNKIIAKLTLLERKGKMLPLMPQTSNNDLLVKTVGNAFSSLELIHYGDIAKDEFIEIPKEIVDIFSLIQQLDISNQQIIEDLKRELIMVVENGTQIPSIEGSSQTVRDDISIDEMYELTNGRVEYGDANSIVKNMFYLARGQSDARKLAEILRQITNNDPKYAQLIERILQSTFRIEPEIITRQSNKGVKISESVSLNLKNKEVGLIEKISNLSDEEQQEIIENGGFSNIENIMSDTFAKVKHDEQISREEYYAEAIFSLYNWNKIGIEEFTLEERNNLIRKIQESNVVEIYKRLEQQGIDRKQIPTVLLNIITGKQGDLNEDLSIERIERFLGYYDVENTRIQLRPYQQEAVDRTDEILTENRFASVILPTGAGKSFVALTELMKYQNKEILYLAPQNEIIEQMKDYIIKYIHGPVNTLGRTKDEIIKEVFPNLRFSTYPHLLSEEGNEIIKKQYDFIVLDELHRTGADKWGEKLDALLENQNEEMRALGITATPRRDSDGANMSIEIAQKLGYTNAEAVAGKHVAINMSLENAIRLRLVVNPKLVSCLYSLREDATLDSLRNKIEQIEDIKEKNEKLKHYEVLRRTIEGADGVSKILRDNVKPGGKYIVFLPMVDQLEDEDGNLIGRKTGQDKIADYEKQIMEYFKDSNIKPNFYSMLGEYGDAENEKRLEEFQNDNSKSTDFMLVINKANEGLHLDKLDGIIWLRALDENSKILYLQQLGRVIYSEDPDNPTKDEDRPVVIDLVNNTLKVNWKDEIIEEDIEMLNLIINWSENHDNILPNINSSDKEENGYALVLHEIQDTYKKYLQGDFGSLNDKQIEEVKKIIELGSKINLWQIELPEKDEKQNIDNVTSVSKQKRIGPFEISGLLKDLIEFENEIEENLISTPLKNAMKIENWCKSNYGDKEIWDRKLPSRVAKDEEEKKLGQTLGNLRTKIKEYEGKDIEEIENEEDRRVVEIIRRIDNEFGLGDSLKNAMKIENWCKVNYGDKEIWDRKLPSSLGKDEEEKKLGKVLGSLRTKIKEYEGKDIEEIENEEDRRVVEIIRRIDNEFGLGDSLKNAMKIENWCKVNYGDKEIWDRKLPSSLGKDEEEKKLGKVLGSLRTKIKEYEGKDIEEIENEEDRRVVEIIRRIDNEFGLGDSLKNAMKIENWCKVNYGDKEIWDRKLPSSLGKDEEEKKLGKVLGSLRTKIKEYEGKDIEEIENEEDRRVVEIIRRIDNEFGLGDSLKNAMKIENWCKVNYGDKEIWDRKLPSRVAKDEEEKKLGEALKGVRKKIKEYEGKDIEEIENEEDRRVVEIIRRIDNEFGLGDSLKNAMKIENWCKVNYGDKEIWDRKLPSRVAKDEEEKKLGKALATLRTKIKEYEEKDIEEIENEEDRRVVEIIRRLYNEYNPRKMKLKEVKKGRDAAKEKNDKAKEMESQVFCELQKRGKADEK